MHFLASAIIKILNTDTCQEVHYKNIIKDISKSKSSMTDMQRQKVLILIRLLGAA